MAHKTDMTGRLLLLSAAAYALLSLVSLTDQVLSARQIRDETQEKVTALEESIAHMEKGGDTRQTARDELKMVFRGEKLIYPEP